MLQRSIGNNSTVMRATFKNNIERENILAYKVGLSKLEINIQNDVALAGLDSVACGICT